MEAKAWGGRFSQPTHELVEHFTASIGFDRRLYAYDIQGSIAHCRMLAKCGIITHDESSAIIHGLQEIASEIERGAFVFDVRWEDIHMHIERRLIEMIGPVGGKLHTARSRNDQVALDVRLYLRDEIRTILHDIRQLQRTLLDLAECHLDVIMPGYTHLQRAQPIRLSHHLLAYDEMLERDHQRLTECLTRVNVLPLGAGALATTTYPIDRAYVAQLLDFPAIAENSLDAVSDRDFVIECCADAALVMMHLSRLSQELTLWCSAEFGFIELADAFATGSSIMPQKKNPDVAELVRGKTGRVYGHLQGVLTVMKGLPLAYNSDMQEDKEALFDVIDTVKACLRVFAPMLANLTLHPERMRHAASEGFGTATDMADYLAAKGLPFRQAHEVVGRIVRHCIDQQLTLDDLSLHELQTFSPLFDNDVYAAIALDASVDRRQVRGGPARTLVTDRIKAIRIARGW
ncbi:MAG TPA: argininosuccinate lyase [Candidatus Tectomicrobia bacterium]|nr:argininosuccinate lyase [Candidatus Tectomicrobia bacterium]